MAIKVTNKKPLFGNKRSHACNATKHAQKPNLQKITLEDGTSIKISARELRTLKKVSKDIEVTEKNRFYLFLFLISKSLIYKRASF